MAPDPMQANFQPYPRLDQVQPDPMYPMQPELLGSPLTPQPPPLQPMWVPGPQMAAMPQQVPFSHLGEANQAKMASFPSLILMADPEKSLQMPSYPMQFQADHPVDQQPQHPQHPPSRQNFRHRRFGKGPVRSS